MPFLYYTLMNILTEIEYLRTYDDLFIGNEILDKEGLLLEMSIIDELIGYHSFLLVTASTNMAYILSSTISSTYKLFFLDIAAQVTVFFGAF